ncbi:hypothetical protein Y032_0544g3226 [Ancylostoma ceylanicum]|uniref:Uncharacterized protein n=1 Tax=Ancylostoma ceylanicum TaxID=53326 RepID=A0A016WS49_9BILA|nr:hypothetical protein Y032_0544g3226 [Ancylostoma ceylanicum]
MLKVMRISALVDTMVVGNLLSSFFVGKLSAQSLSTTCKVVGYWLCNREALDRQLVDKKGQKQVVNKFVDLASFTCDQLVMGVLSRDQSFH